MFPVTLCVEKARCLVVGGGSVALRKAESLMREGADVTVVAPDAVAGLRDLASAGSIAWERRTYRTGEAGAFRLVFAATDRCEVNRQVHDDAVAANVSVNVADDPELCTFQLPARLDRGPLQIAISSQGGAPFVVRRLRELLERRLDASWGEWAAAAARFRARVHASVAAADARQRAFDRFFSATVDGGGLRVRVPADGEAEGWLAEDADGPLPVGLVSLVGAGPGSAGLLTVRGLNRLMAADTVVYDRLAESALPCDLPVATELISVGKEAGHHSVPQDEINALLIALARRGKRVVRLKGGDPFIFGRGGEEALALRRAGVPCEVVPGISAGVAGPAYAGVPVTQRGMATSLTLFTAHRAAEQSAQARKPSFLDAAGSTLVGFMGVGNLATLAEELERHGLAADTPAMLIERASTSAQRRVSATVATLDGAARAAGIRPPALLVVGETVRLADELAWYERLPLAGERLLLAAPGGGLGEDLDLAGAEVLEVPLPPTPAALVALRALPLTGWVARTAGEARSIAAVLATEASAKGAVAFCSCAEAAEAARAAGWPAVRALDRCAGGGELARAIGAVRR